METIEKKLYQLKNYFYYETRFLRLARIVDKLADFVSNFNHYGLKFTLLDVVWNTSKQASKGETYSYETAPYCGHHFSGFENKYITSSFHEGDGGGETKFSIFGYKLHYSNVDKREYWVAKQS